MGQKTFQYIDKNENHSYPKSEQQWVAWINGSHEAALRTRQAHEFTWAVNIAYAKGQQKLRYIPSTNILYKDEQEDDTYVINRCSAFVKSRTAKLVRSRPVLSVSPETSDIMDAQAAQMSEHLLKHLWKILGKQEKLNTYALMMVLMGSAFKKIIWNPKAGVSMQVTKEHEGQTINFTDDGIEQEEVFMGEIEHHIRSAWNILASPGATSIESASWLIDRIHKPVDYIRTRYPDINTKKLKRDAEYTSMEIFTQNIASAISPSFAFKENYDQQDEENEITLIKEYWQKPTSVYPRGVLAAVIGDQLASFGPWPSEKLIEYNMYPFVKCDEYEDPFSFYGDATLTNLIPIQKHYNTSRTRIKENVNLMTNAKWFVPLGSGIEKSAFTDEPGEIINYNSNVDRPAQADIKPLPNYVVQDQQQDIEDFRDVSSEKETSVSPPPGLTAGIAISTAAELSEISLSTILKNLEHSQLKEARIELAYANEYYSDERMMKIEGENGIMKVVAFKGIDLKNQTDVGIKVESAVGFTKIAQQQRLFDFWDRQIITDRKTWLNAYHSGNMEVIFNQIDKENGVIAEVIHMIKEGAMPPFYPSDNHITFIGAISEFMQSPEFRRIAPDRQQIAMMVLQQHLQAVQPVQQAAPNQAAVGTPFGSQVTEGARAEQRA